MTNRSAGFDLPRQDFQALQHNEPSNDGVGCGDSWDDVSRHGWKADRQTDIYLKVGVTTVQGESERETPISALTLSKDNSHLTSKRLFMFMLKMCMRRFAAAVTKSIAGGSS